MATKSAAQLIETIREGRRKAATGGRPHARQEGDIHESKVPREEDRVQEAESKAENANGGRQVQSGRGGSLSRTMVDTCDWVPGSYLRTYPPPPPPWWRAGECYSPYQPFLLPAFRAFWVPACHALPPPPSCLLRAPCQRFPSYWAPRIGSRDLA